MSSWPGQFSLVGVPTTLKILMSSSYYFWPGNNGFMLHIYAKMQPTDQISMLFEYFWEPNNTSGGLYQRVTTSCVNPLVGIPEALAKPKSAIFKT